MEQGKPEKSFRRSLARALVIAGVILLALWFLSWLATPRLQKYVVKSRDSAAQNLLLQLALAQVAHQTDTGRYGADWPSLEEYGFRLDRNVRVLLVVIDLNWGTGQLQGFLAKANHVADKSRVYVYDNIVSAGVQPAPKLKRLGEEYTATVVEEGDPSGGQPARMAGPPVLIVRIPGLAERSAPERSSKENQYGAE